MSNVTILTSAEATARRFDAEAKAAGLSYTITGTTVRITHTFTPGDTAGFLVLDCDATSLLQTLPNTGSTYGLEGVGGHLALQNGRGTVKHTGVRASVIRALERLQSKPAPGTIADALRTALPEFYGSR